MMAEQSQHQDPRLDPSHPPPWQPLDRLAVGHLWQIGKQVDELGGEWTYPIFTFRVCNFNLVSVPIAFYEPIESFERLALEVMLIQKARGYGLDQTAGLAGIALTVFPSIFDTTDGVLRLPEEDELAIGEHYVNIVGMRDYDTLVIQNSWSGWTPDGLGYLNREYFERYATEGWIYRRWDYGPSEDTADTLLSTSEASEFRQRWQRRRRFGSSSSVVPNKDVRLKWFACWSLQDERPAEILLVELKQRIRVGVAILIHYKATDGSPAVSSLSDFFVWPNYRRVGYGSLLERFAAERSAVAGSSELATHVWNADAVTGRKRAEAFLRATGYNDIQVFSDMQYMLYAKRAIA
jgi:GNAT superfamily N-acetyltransferase